VIEPPELVEMICEMIERMRQVYTGHKAGEQDTIGSTPTAREVL
jgi:hypothetical protein